LVTADTEAMTASRFFFEWLLASLKPDSDFSIASLKAWLPAVVNFSTVDFTASAAAAGI